jgi:hypothetical protein
MTETTARHNTTRRSYVAQKLDRNEQIGRMWVVYSVLLSGINVVDWPAVREPQRDGSEFQDVHTREEEAVLLKAIVRS